MDTLPEDLQLFVSLKGIACDSFTLTYCLHCTSLQVAYYFGAELSAENCMRPYQSKSASDRPQRRGFLALLLGAHAGAHRLVRSPKLEDSCSDGRVEGAGDRGHLAGPLHGSRVQGGVHVGRAVRVLVGRTIQHRWVGSGRSKQYIWSLRP